MLVIDTLLWWVSLVLVLFGVEFSVCSCWFGVAVLLWCLLFGFELGCVWLIWLFCALYCWWGGFDCWWFAWVCGFILIVLVIRCGDSCVASCWVDYGVCICVYVPVALRWAWFVAG